MAGLQAFEFSVFEDFLIDLDQESANEQSENDIKKIGVEVPFLLVEKAEDNERQVEEDEKFFYV